MSVTATSIESPSATEIPANDVNQITLEAPTGYVPVAANWFVSSNGDAAGHPELSLVASGPTISDTSWTIVLNNASGSVDVKMHLLSVEGSVE